MATLHAPVVQRLSSQTYLIFCILAIISSRAVCVSRALRGSPQAPVSSFTSKGSQEMPSRTTMKSRFRVKSGRRRSCSSLSVPKSPTIVEVTEDSSPNDSSKRNSENKFSGHPRIQESEYTSLSANNHRRKSQTRFYGSTYTKHKYPESSGDTDSCCSASDEMSSNASVTSKMSSRQFLIFIIFCYCCCYKWEFRLFSRTWAVRKR